MTADATGAGSQQFRANRRGMVSLVIFGGCCS